MIKTLVCTHFGLHNPTIVYCNGVKCTTQDKSIEEIVKTWQETFDIFPEEITILVCTTTKLFQAISQRTLAVKRSVNEILREDYNILPFNGEGWMNSQNMIDLLIKRGYKISEPDNRYNSVEIIERLLVEASRIKKEQEEINAIWNNLPESLKAIVLALNILSPSKS